MNSQPRIAFCTTCKGRAQHVEETLPKNLLDNCGYQNAVFIILDYNSQDHLLEFVKTRHSKALSSWRLVVYSYRVDTSFHLSHAKNMAARLGILEGADILVTMDADNFTGPGFAQFIAEKFKAAPQTQPGMFLSPNFPLIHSLPYGPSRPLRGFAGRLAIRAQDFVKMGGYDETFDTWRGEDIDMISRLEKVGYRAQFIDNSYLIVIPHNAAVRFKEYPHARELFENKGQLKVIDKRTVTVVNYGRWGVGTVYNSFTNKEVKLLPLPTRIFGIGLHKTGTTSLDAAFKILGYDSLHWGTGEAPKIWNEMHSTGHSKTLEAWYAFSDLPIPVLYRELDKAYPGSKFILTIRNEQAWVKSVEKLWDPRYNPTRWMWDVYPFSNRVHKALYGREDFDRDTFLARYRRHNQEVQGYFKSRPDDLYVMDIDKEDKWPGLCAFLGVPEPSVPYPASNVTTKAPVEVPAARMACQQHIVKSMQGVYGDGI